MELCGLEVCDAKTTYQVQQRSKNKFDPQPGHLETGVYGRGWASTWLNILSPIIFSQNSSTFSV